MARVENVFRQSSTYVVRKARRWPALRSDADDVAQDIAIGAWVEAQGDEANLGRFLAGRSRFNRNFSRPAQQLTRFGFTNGLTERLSVLPSGEPEASVESVVAYEELVKTCRTTLSSIEYGALRLVGELGLPRDEAAKQLGVSERTIRYALERARTKMQEKLLAA